MKGSPIISTILIILVLFGIYVGARSILLKDVPAISAEPHGHDHEGHDHGDHEGHDHGDHEGHDHGDHEGHDHGDHEGHDHEDHSNEPKTHDDSSLETQFEITFSTKPKSIKITQPSTKKVIINTTEIDGLEYTTNTNMSLDGHSVELAVEIQWENPGELNFTQISLSPANHGTKEATLKSETHIDDIAEFHW